MKYIKEIITPKNLWTTLVMGSLLIFLWIFAGFTVKYFIYEKQGNHSIAQVFDWGVIEMDDEAFVICADFKFHTNGQEEYVSQHLFEDSVYLSQEGAEAAISQMKVKEWNCYWYGSEKNPIVSMERTFPVKPLVYSLISLAVCIYFSLLKKRVAALS